jgi:heme oxygenase
MAWSLPHSSGHALGVWYVVLGAQLGGLAIARHLQQVAPHLPVAALAADPAAVHSRWADFTALATQLGQDRATRQQALHAASAAFRAIADHLNGFQQPPVSSQPA